MVCWTSPDSELSGCDLCGDEVWVRFSQIKLSQIHKETKFSPVKETRYTVICGVRTPIPALHVEQVTIQLKI